MNNLIRFPDSYVFIAGYNMYKTFARKSASSLEENSRSIAYVPIPKSITETSSPIDVVRYYIRNHKKYQDEAAKITILPSLLLDSLVNMTYNFSKNKHITQDQFDLLFNRMISFVKDNIDMSSVYYIYCRYHPDNVLDAGRSKDSITASILSSYDVFHYSSIYSKEPDRRIRRLDTLLNKRLEEISRTKRFKEIIKKD